MRDDLKQALALVFAIAMPLSMVVGFVATPAIPASQPAAAADVEDVSEVSNEWTYIDDNSKNVNDAVTSGSSDVVYITNSYTNNNVLSGVNKDDGSQAWNITSYTRPGLAIDESSGDAYIAHGGGIDRVDDTGSITTINSNSISTEGSAAYYNGAVYVVTTNGFIQKYDAQSGGLVWENTLDSIPTAVEVDKANGAIYTTDDNIYKFSPDGTQEFKKSASGHRLLGVGDGHFYTQKDSIVQWDSSGNQQWKNGISGSNVAQPHSVHEIADGEVYAVLEDSNIVRKINVDTGDTVWDIDANNSWISLAGDDEDDVVYAGGANGTVKAYSVAFNKPTVTGYVKDPAGNAINNATVEFGGATTTIASDGSYAIKGVPVGKGTLAANTSIDSTEEQIVVPNSQATVSRNLTLANGDIGGQVVACPISDRSCADPSPVANATVQVVNYNTTEIQSQFSDVSSPSEARAKAKELDAKITDFELDSYESGLNPLDKYGDGDAVYPVIHTHESWGLSGIGGNPTVANRPNHLIDLEDPGVTFSTDTRLVVSLWDPTDQDRVFVEPGDEEFPGSTTSGVVTFTELGRLGEVLSTKEVQTIDRVAVSGGSFSFNSKTHELAEISLSPGYYRVSAEGSEVSYPIKIGSPTLRDVAPGYVRNITDHQDTLIDQAQTLENLKNNGSVALRRVKTDDNGRWGMDIAKDSHIDRVGVAAAKTPPGDIIGTNLSDPATKQKFEDGDFSDDFITELGNARDSGYNGSVYLPSSTRQINVPGTVTLDMSEVSLAPFSDENLTEQQLQLAANLFNSTVDEIRELWDIPAANMTEDQIGSARNRTEEGEDVVLKYASKSDKTCSELIEEKNASQAVICRGTNAPGGGDQGFDNTDPDELADQEMLDRLRELEQMIAENSDPPEESGDVTITNNTLGGEFPMPGDVDSEAVSALVEYSNGTVRTVNDSHYTVEETINPLDGEQVVVEGINVTSDDPNPTLRVDAVVDEGGPLTDDQNSTTIVTARQDVINPAYPNDVPQLKAIDANTLTPGSDSRVVLRPIAEQGAGYRRVVNATVYGPNGREIPSETQDSDTVGFTTNGTGTYTSRIRYANNAGDIFVETVPIKAADNVGATPPTIRLRGTTRPPVAGDGLSDATFAITEGGSTVDVAATLSGKTEITELHVRGLDDIPHDDIDLSITKANDQTLRKHVSLVLYRSVDDNTLLYRNDDAFSQRGGDPAGAYDDDAGVIRTFSTEDATATVELITTPSRLERLAHWVDRRTQTLPTVLSMGPVLGLGLVSVCRRWWV